MIKIILSALVATMTLAAIPATSMTLRQWQMQKVQETIDATSHDKGQWLPYWNHIAEHQFALIKDTSLNLTAALTKAKQQVDEYYPVIPWGSWDDSFYCATGTHTHEKGGFLPLYGDLKFDYCKHVLITHIPHRSIGMTKAYDPDPSTDFGGLFWTDEGKI